MKTVFIIRKKFKDFVSKAATVTLDGIGVIEIILILVIIIGLVLIFRNQIAEIIQDAFASINSDTGEITTDIVIPTKTP